MNLSPGTYVALGKWIKVPKCLDAGYFWHWGGVRHCISVCENVNDTLRHCVVPDGTGSVRYVAGEVPENFKDDEQRRKYVAVCSSL